MYPHNGFAYTINDGMFALARALEKNKTLIRLHLAYSTPSPPFDLPIQWFEPFAEALKINNTLKSLDICLPYEDNGLIGAVLTDGLALTDLDIYGNQLDPDVISSIISFVKINHNLTHLKIHNPLPEPEKNRATLQGYIERNIKRNQEIITSLEVALPPPLVGIVSEYAQIPYTYTPPPKTEIPPAPSTPKTTQAPKVNRTQPSRLSQIWVWLRDRLNRLYQFIINLFSSKKTSTENQTTSSEPDKTVSAQTNPPRSTLLLLLNTYKTQAVKIKSQAQLRLSKF